MSAELKKRDCAKCGVSFEPIEHSPAKYCVDCRDPRSLRRSAKRAAARGEDSVAYQAALRNPMLQGVAGALAPLRLAVTLGVIDDDRQACALVGVDYDEDLCDNVRAEYPELTAGDTGALQQLLGAAQLQVALTMLERAPEVPPAQLGAALRSIGQALELTQKGGKRVYGTLIVQRGDDGAENG